MVYIKQNTLLYQELISSLDADLKLFNQYIDEYFSLIKQVTETTHSWSGSVADEFIESLLSTRDNYVDFSDNISDFISVLSNSSDELNKTINISKLEV